MNLFRRYPRVTEADTDVIDFDTACLFFATLL
jgi:hypothetical protein